MSNITLSRETATLQIATVVGGVPLSDDTPLSVGAAASGVAAESSRADHVHAHGNQNISAKVADYPLVELDGSGLFTNDGSVSQVVMSLPSASSGQQYDFYVKSAQNLRILASAGDTIRIADQVSIVAGYIESSTVGSLVSLVAINATEWIAKLVVLSWGVQTS